MAPNATMVVCGILFGGMHLNVVMGFVHLHNPGKEIFVFTTHFTHFIYGYMAGIW